MRRWLASAGQRSRLLAALAALAVTGWTLVPTAVFAQAGKSKKSSAAETSKRSGKIAEVEKKGKAATLTVEEADGEKFPVQIAPKTKFVVNGKGDAAFFKLPHVSVSSERIVMNPGNNYLFGKTFTVYLGAGAPEPTFERDPNSPEVCHIAGPVVDADDESFTINVSGTPYKINLEKGAAPDISVVSTDAAHAAVGAEIEVEGTTRAGKFHPTSVVVNLDRPMVADEVLASGDKKGAKTKSAGKTKPAKKTARSKSDDGDAGIDGDAPAGEPIKQGSDPFNVLNKGNKKESKKGGTKPVPQPKKPFNDGGNG